MIVEYMLLMQHSHIREEIRLKENGIKTEPAFAQVLNIEGDPYEGLIVLGQEMRL